MTSARRALEYGGYMQKAMGLPLQYGLETSFWMFNHDTKPRGFNGEDSGSQIRWMLALECVVDHTDLRLNPLRHASEFYPRYPCNDAIARAIVEQRWSGAGFSHESPEILDR